MVDRAKDKGGYAQDEGRSEHAEKHLEWNGEGRIELQIHSRSSTIVSAKMQEFQRDFFYNGLLDIIFSSLFCTSLISAKCFFRAQF